MSDLTQYEVDGYLPTVGIECHVQLKTKTKLFSGVGNDAREAAPNTLISHIDLGMPGALPVLNEAAVELASRAAFALNSRPAAFSKFDRKHYFYPDLPNGYQITQFDQPIVLGGHVDITVGGQKRKIGVTRAHLEADAGKSTHPAGADYTLVDLNRAGTPLLEIVSEPDIHSAEEAKAYAHELYLLMRYAEVSEANLFYGNMRFDVNVSVSKDPKKLGTRSETKNLNSFKAVQGAVDYEIKRQIELLEKGGEVVQETRGWEDATQKTFSQRGKEDAHDYRYFPDPDLPPVVLDEAYIKDIEKSMPALPGDYRSVLAEIDVDSSIIDTLLMSKHGAEFVYTVKNKSDKVHARRLALWIANATEQFMQGNVQSKSTGAPIEVEDVVELSTLVENGEISSTSAKEIWLIMTQHGGDPLTIAKERNLLQVSDEAEIEKIVQQVIRDNPQAATDVKNGEMKAIGFLVGQIMKESKGRANPALAQKLIKKQIGV